MFNVLLTGKPNEMMKDLHRRLSQNFRVQVSTEDVSIFEGILKVVTPDIIIMSLVGIYKEDAKIFRAVSRIGKEIPVITIGTKEEYEQFVSYHTDDQFENIIRPTSYSVVYEAICRKLNINGEDISEKPKILVVDDNVAALRTIKIMLEDEYKINLAKSGTKAVASIGREKPDLILLDYEMPVCDGRQTLEMIRSDEDIRDIPVIFLTSVADRAHIEAVLQLKPAGYLLKPPDKEKLMNKIHEVLQKHEI